MRSADVSQKVSDADPSLQIANAVNGSRKIRRCVFGALSITLAAGLGAGACAESQGFGEIPDGEPGVIPREECNGTPGATACGMGCCAPGFSCSRFGSCIPGTECGDGLASCSSDTLCAPAGAMGNRCTPWDNLTEGTRYNRNCRTAIDLPSIIPQVQCRWPGDTAPSEFPESVQVVGTPMVVDFDFDGDPATIKPSIVFVSYEGQYSENRGVVRVIDGETCSLQDTITSNSGQAIFRPQVSPALGDINGDGRADIVVADVSEVSGIDRSAISVYAWSGEGTTFGLLARQTSASTAIINGIALHDLDNEDPPEILTQNTILQFDGRNLLTISDDQDPGRAAMLEPPVVCDIEGNGGAELVTARGIFSWDTLEEELVPKVRDGGGPFWNSNQDELAQFVALADLGDFNVINLGGNDSVEMVAIGFTGELFVKLVDGETIHRVTDTNGVGGPPVIADFDGDGRMEFASPGRDEITVFDLDCVDGLESEGDCDNPSGPNRNGVLWAKPIKAAASGVAVFDFDGDRRAEVVFADQCFMRVYDGRSGEVLFSVPRSSVTRWEYPVVADTDGDGTSELVTTSNDNNNSVSCPATDPENDNQVVEFEPSHGVTVWEDPDDGWAGSRPIWNQHDYFVTNVNDDGTIPPMLSVKSHWNVRNNPERPNTFRQNVQGATGRSLEEPDITTLANPAVKCADAGGSAEFTVNVCNRGLRTLRPGEASVTLLMAEDLRRQLCNPSNEDPLPSATCATLTCTAAVPSRSFDVTIMGDLGGAVDECDEDNNQSAITGVYCPGIQ